MVSRESMCPKQTGARTCLKQAGVGRVDQKLISLAPVQGIVAGQFGEVSEASEASGFKPPTPPWPLAGSTLLAQVLASADYYAARRRRGLLPLLICSADLA